MGPRMTRKPDDTPSPWTIVLYFGDEVTLAGLAFVTGYDWAQRDKGDMWRLNNRP